MKRTHSDYRNLLMKRTQSLSERPKAKTQEVGTPVREALKDLFKQIEVSVFMHRDIDYGLLFNELNQTILELKKSANRRMLYNKKKAKGLITENESVNEPLSLVVTDSSPIINDESVNEVAGSDSKEVPNKPLGNIEKTAKR